MRTIGPAIAATIWLGVVIGGTGVLYVYGTQPGDADETPAPLLWPVDTELPRTENAHTLLLFAHPRCPCTRASFEMLQRVLLQSRVPVVCHLVFVAPLGVDEAWMDGPLINEASHIPGMQVHRDLHAREARRFGATTSGHVLLYDHHGALAFSGGITASRGHAGNNFASDSISMLLSGSPDRAATRQAPVYGCPLFNADDCRETEQTCQK